MNNSFIWADLSTFNIRKAKRFYKRCFGWHYQEMGEGYLLCLSQKQSSAGLYTMPQEFRSIGMPSFWMSYIHVQDIEETVRQAEKHGAKVEIKPQQAPGGGRIALIRDPSGAGFTCYEGEALGGRDKNSSLGRMVWNELHVSELEKVKDFYTHVFDWHIEETTHKDRYEIFTSTSETEPIAGIQVSSNEIKGDKEYWGVYFLVNNLSTASRQIERSGGQVVGEQPLGNRPALLAYDQQGAAFYVVERALHSNTDPQEATKHSPKWRAILGLVIVATAVLLEANWIWGLLFLLWVIPDIQHGSTHFLEHVEQRKNPVIYWLIVTTWVVLSIYLLFDWTIGA